MALFVVSVKIVCHLVLQCVVILRCFYLLLLDSVIRDMICLERALDEALDQLKSRLQALRPDTDLAEDAADDLDSIASSTMNSLSAPHRRVRTVRFSDSREVKTLQKKLSQMEHENQALRSEVRRLKSLLGHSDDEEKKADEDKDGRANIMSEGGVLKFIRGSISLPS